ncbi:winged helix-turn-helix domain-containing protein [Dankookia sp. P2]|uniref:winged helix-turn-helix domain-containing protein n=1 Tax=Dankookia sp. P2 TaxID=3423955 RepID=UPI003D67D409
MLYRVDGFELDPARHALRRNGVPCHVERLVFDLLAFLVRNPGRVVGREEVVAAVLQGRSVSEATISSCVQAARRALGDSGEDPTHIRTIRGHGFGFADKMIVPGRAGRGA